MIKTITALLLISRMMFTPVSSGEVYNWFFKSGKNGEQPLVFDGNKMPDRYDSLYMGSAKEKKIYLTFDAGYDNGNVTKIVDILEKQNITGAFFILPEMAKNHSELLKRMAESGNLICNHSSTHGDMSKISSYDVFLKELTDLENIYTENTGYTMNKYFRPPEGKFSEKTLEFCKKSGYVPVFWSFAYADWDNSAQKDTSWAYEKIMSNVHNGMVMLLHPTSATNAAILDKVITELKKRGYDFGTLDELYFSQKADSLLSANSSLQYYKDKEMVFCENPTAGKKIAITFDDGPHATLTDRILDILGKYGIKATFFVIGKNAEAHPEQVKRIIAEGHEIGNHTYSHLLLKNTPLNKWESDITKAQALFEKEFAYRPKLFRPPGGAYTPEAIERICDLGYKYVLWAWKMDTKDWACPSVDKVVHTVMNAVSGGDIVLFHDYNDGKTPTPEALEKIIPKLLGDGYSFVTVSELFA